LILLFDIVWPNLSFFDVPAWNLDKGFYFWSWIQFWNKLAYFWYIWYRLTYFFVFYVLEIWTRGVICVILYVEFNFDSSWPTLGIIDTIWPTYLYFYIHILNLVKLCKFWYRNEFWHQLTYFDIFDIIWPSFLFFFYIQTWSLD
jgi:hypothetical protein